MKNGVIRSKSWDLCLRQNRSKLKNIQTYCGQIPKLKQDQP